MSIISLGSYAKALWPGVHKWYGVAYKDRPECYKDIFDIRKSDKNFEEIMNHFGLSLARKTGEHEGVAYDKMEQGYAGPKRFTHDKYTAGFQVSREHIEDNQYMQIAEDRAKALARAMRETKEIVCADVLNNAFDSNYTMIDGVELCSSLNVRSRDGSTYRTELATPADLSETSLEQALIDIHTQTDDSGYYRQFAASKLIIPPALMFDAERILASVLQNDTANNAINAMKSKGMLSAADVSVNPYLTDSDAWFVKTDVPDGFILFERRKVELAQDVDFDSEVILHKATERYSVGVGNKRCVMGSEGAA